MSQPGGPARHEEVSASRLLEPPEYRRSKHDDYREWSDWTGA